jgi:pyruvate carboxylase subunit B
MEVRSMTQKFIDDGLGYWMDPSNSKMSSLLVGCGLPGGMMGSMMADLRGFQAAVNASLRAQGKQELTTDRLMVMLFKEVEYVWPRLGYPPLVTPFSQYVKNTALMNLMHILKGQSRWTTIDRDTWNMILGRMGRLPGEIAPEIRELAREKGLEFYEGNPQEAYPNELDKYRAIIMEEGWECGQDDEELFELAMHERQYRDYRNGQARERFESGMRAEKSKEATPVQAPAKGQVLWQIDLTDSSSAPVTGTEVKAGEPLGYIQTFYGMEEIIPAKDGRILAVNSKQGEYVTKGEVVALIQ